MRFGERAPAGVLPLLNENVASAHRESPVGVWALGLLALAIIALAASLVYRRTQQRSSFMYSSFAPGTQQPAECVVVDCTAPKQFKTLSHHKGCQNPPHLQPADSSTGLVLNALESSAWLWGGPVFQCCQRPVVSSNHFDVDSFLSVWCYTNRPQALKAAPVLRHMARIGDFREGYLSPDLVSLHGREDGITSIREALAALKLCCWLNTLERRLFSRSFEEKDCDEKFAYFLPRFGAVLADPEAHWSDWQDEYKMVMGGFEQLVQSMDYTVEVVKRVGLAVLQGPDPLHYYSLFSHTHGADTVLMMWDDNRYEVEQKYTGFVSVHSRPVWPRLDMGSLAAVLNKMEGDALPAGTCWVANRFNDSGPLLRLEKADSRLTKAQRYGHPYERPILSSSLEPAIMAALVQSFLEFGYQGITPKKGGWSWDELQDLNQRVKWQTWMQAVLDQHTQGELLLPATPEMVRSRNPDRRSSRDDRHGHLLSPPASGTTTLPPMSDGGSSIMSKEDTLALISSCLPPLLTQSKWDLTYCTQRDGISLHTLYRKAAGKHPTVLVIQDAGGAVFGAFVTDAWRVGPRFFGTGETRVFQLQPRRVSYQWHPPKGSGAAAHTDFFQFATHEGLGVGGAGHFAIWVDNDLFEGSSAECLTFGSPCLASSPDFHVRALELWHLH